MSGSPLALWINPILLTSGSAFAIWISLILHTSSSLFGLWMSTILLSGNKVGCILFAYDFVGITGSSENLQQLIDIVWWDDSPRIILGLSVIMTSRDTPTWG